MKVYILHDVYCSILLVTPKLERAQQFVVDKLKDAKTTVQWERIEGLAIPLWASHPVISVKYYHFIEEHDLEETTT